MSYSIITIKFSQNQSLLMFDFVLRLESVCI